MSAPIGEVITLEMRNKQIAEVLRDGRYMRLRMTNGQDFLIEWVDEHGIPVKGYPRLCDRIDAVIVTGSAGGKLFGRR